MICSPLFKDFCLGCIWPIHVFSRCVRLWIHDCYDTHVCNSDDYLPF